MIGQENLKKSMVRIKMANFIILVGEKGSGKKTFIREYLNETSTVWLNSVKVEDVRHMITLAYKVNNNVFVIPDADDMSLAAKNAMLKVIEECPNNNKFIMTLTDINNTLDTIKSRGSIFNMDRYTEREIKEYATQYNHEYPLIDRNWEIIKDVCDVPGDVNILMDNPFNDVFKNSPISDNPRVFYDYVELVFNNIAEVSGANAFKIADKIALKDEDDKYNLKLFWRAFLKKCISEGSKKNGEYLTAVKITANALNDLRIKGINKQMLFDMWLLKIREAWM